MREVPALPGFGAPPPPPVGVPAPAVESEIAGKEVAAEEAAAVAADTVVGVAAGGDGAPTRPGNAPGGVSSGSKYAGHAVDELRKMVGGDESISVQVDFLRMRLSLEEKLTVMVLKLPNFCFTLLCFMVAISYLVPSDNISAIHAHLYSHFKVGHEDLVAIDTFDKLYTFVYEFEHANEELSATSSLYWCESRYFQLEWNDALLVPTRKCPSPRLKALGKDTDVPMTWLDWQRSFNTSYPGYSGSGSSSHGSSAGSSGAGSTSAGSNASHGSSSASGSSASGNSSAGSSASGSSSAGSSAAGIDAPGTLLGTRVVGAVLLEVSNKEFFLVSGSTQDSLKAAWAAMVARFAVVSGADVVVKFLVGRATHGTHSSSGSSSHSGGSSSGTGSRRLGGAGGQATGAGFVHIEYEITVFRGANVSVDDVRSRMANASGEDMLADVEALPSESHTAAVRYVDPVQLSDVRRICQEAAGTAGGSAHRRLGGAPAASTAASAGGGTGLECYVCANDDFELQREEGHHGGTLVTCENIKGHICGTDLGVTLCPVTCGYCPFFEYEHLKEYPKPMTTMLPVMVHQTRYAKADCHYFAEVYENQPHNYDLNLLPALDGPRHGRTLTCIDRSKHFDGDFAHELECPEGGPEAFCDENLTMRMTAKHTYHGDTVYSVFLTEPHKNIASMRAMQWFDLQTEAVTLSTLVYTEDLEIFTSLSVIFKVDLAGNLEGHVKMISYTDISETDQPVFVALLILANLGSALGLILSLYKLYKDQACNWGMTCYELLARAIMCIYCLVLQLTWAQQIPMSVEYDHLLHTILDFHGHGHAEWEKAAQSYFDVKTHIYHETQWLMSHRMATYLILYTQLLQMIFYFHCHPRMAALTKTIQNSLDLMFHFFLVFFVIFVALGFMASWMLGGEVEAFKSFRESMASMGRMLFGEWIYAENAEELFGNMTIMYWIFALTFMVVLFFSLLNFFLAIIVDSYMGVQAEAAADPSEMNFFMDMLDAVYTPLKFMRRRWPNRKTIDDALLKVREETPPSADCVVGLEDLGQALPSSMHGSVSDFVLFYAKKCGDIVSSAEKTVTPGSSAKARGPNKNQLLKSAVLEAEQLLLPVLNPVFGEDTKVFHKLIHKTVGAKEIIRVDYDWVPAQPAKSAQHQEVRAASEAEGILPPGLGKFSSEVVDCDMVPESLVRSSTPENLCLGYNPSSPPEQCSTDGPFAQAEAIVQPEEAQGKQVVEAEAIVQPEEAQGKQVVEAEAIVQPEEAQGKHVVEETLVDLREASLPEPAPEPRMDIQVRVTEQPRSPKSNRSPSPQLGSQAAAAAEGRAIWRPSAAAAEGHARQSRSASRSRSPARSGKGSLPDCPFPLDDSAVPLKSVAAI